MESGVSSPRIMLMIDSATLTTLFIFLSSFSGQLVVCDYQVTSELTHSAESKINKTTRLNSSYKTYPFEILINNLCFVLVLTMPVVVCYFALGFPDM